jgi:hypothetical protein
MANRRGDPHGRRYAGTRRPKQYLGGNDEHHEHDKPDRQHAPPVERDLGHVANRGNEAVTCP